MENIDLMLSIVGMMRMFLVDKAMDPNDHHEDSMYLQDMISFHQMDNKNLQDTHLNQLGLHYLQDSTWIQNMVEV